MSILDKINSITNEVILTESGMQNISKILKGWSKARIYMHKDLDGITSAIGFKEYIKRYYNITTVAAEPINYGGEEYAITKAKKDEVPILVDFAHGKPFIMIWTDHHDGQVGLQPGQSSDFVKTPSNAQAISQTISPTDIFPARDIDVISKVDSADFARWGLTPDDIMRASFKLSKDVDVSRNHEMMGFVVNKLLLAFKNKDSFLSSLVMQSKPSLISMYNVILKLAKENGYKAPEEIDVDSDRYVQQRQKKMIPSGSPSKISSLANGESFIIGSTIVQNGGGYMGKGNQYDRYAIFKLYPDADFLLTMWPMGLIQLAKNPFISKKNPYHLGDMAMKILDKFKGQLSKEMVTLDYMKYVWERDIIKKGIAGAVGFVWSDFEALYRDKAKGLEGSEKWQDIVKDISNKPYSGLSDKQKDILKKISVSAWDIIKSQSGGHKDITNISGLVFLRDTKRFMINFAEDLAKEMQNKRLE